MRGSIKRDFPKFLTSDNRREKDEGKKKSFFDFGLIRFACE